MAHRIITQVVVTGSRVFGRAFAEAWRQAQASQKYAAANAAAGHSGATSASGVTMDEACKILNVSPPKKGVSSEVALQDLEKVRERFKKMFDLNDPQKGGSFYLQSKVLRARERIEAELKEIAEWSEAEEELKTGSWKPKVYKK